MMLHKQVPSTKYRLKTLRLLVYFLLRVMAWWLGQYFTSNAKPWSRAEVVRNSLNTGVLRGHFECIFEVGNSIACDLRQAHVGDSFEAALHVQSQGASRFSGPASGGKKEQFLCIQILDINY